MTQTVMLPLWLYVLLLALAALVMLEWLLQRVSSARVVVEGEEIVAIRLWRRIP